MKIKWKPAMCIIRRRSKYKNSEEGTGLAPSRKRKVARLVQNWQRQNDNEMENEGHGQNKAGF